MPEKYIIFSGRPNAGKSTTINVLTGLRVPTGKQPGTTTKLNMYPLAKGLFLVDMPGYGKKVGASKKWVNKTKDNILDFIERNAENIVVAIHVINITTFIEVQARLAKKGFLSLDVEMVNYLHQQLERLPLVAANKIDKGREKDVMMNLKAFIDRIAEDNPEMAAMSVYPISAKKGIGVGSLKSDLRNILVQEGFRNPFELIKRR